MIDADRSLIVYVVSDSAGETGEFVVRAAAAQFHPIPTDIRRAPFIQDVSALERVVLRAKQTGGIILFTLVIPTLREELVRLSKTYEVECIDLLGQLVASFERQTGKVARQEPGLNHVLDANYFRKVDAVEFAVKYDDARDTTGVLKADIVLVGVSRTSKTPLSMYLAHKKYKVANVPLIPELKPPQELFSVPKDKIIGLTIGVPYLNIIRKERLKALGLPDTAAYATAARIEQELAYAEAIMKQLDCNVIDVSFRAVEETASLIMERIRLQT